MLGRRELELRKKRAVEQGRRNLSWKHRRPGRRGRAQVLGELRRMIDRGSQSGRVYLIDGKENKYLRQLRRNREHHDGCDRMLVVSVTGATVPSTFVMKAGVGTLAHIRLDCTIGNIVEHIRGKSEERKQGGKELKSFALHDVHRGGMLTGSGPLVNFAAGRVLAAT